MGVAAASSSAEADAAAAKATAAAASANAALDGAQRSKSVRSHWRSSDWRVRWQSALEAARHPRDESNAAVAVPQPSQRYAFLWSTSATPLLLVVGGNACGVEKALTTRSSPTCDPSAQIDGGQG